MEEEKVPSKPADARVVRAVRKLKSNITQSSNTLEENKAKDSKTESSKAVSRDTEKESDTNLKILSNKSINNIRQKIPSKNSNNKILLDGSIKPPTDKAKTFDYETLKRYKKRQNTSFQKNLLSADNINKYKEEFVGIIKKDKNIKSMLDQLNLIKDDNYMEYIENHFFNKPHFLFVLEMLIFDEVEQTNTLKAFRTKKSVPLKVIKENYFKDEITKELQKQLYQNEYESKAQNLLNNLDAFIQNMKNEPLNL
jgi:hypothetical protein